MQTNTYASRQLKAILTIFVLAAPFTAAAATATATQSLYERALVENSSIGSSAKPAMPTTAAIAPEAAAEGMLSLKDTYQIKNLRAWRWNLGLNLQNFGAQGTYTAPSGESGDLGAVKKVWMPVFDFGVASAPASNAQYLRGLMRVGFATQEMTLNTYSESNQVSQVSLLSTLLAAQMQWGYQEKSSGIGALVELGRLSYSQALVSAKTNLNRTIQYLGYGFATQHKISPNLSAKLAWIQRQNFTDSESRIQSSNFEAGLFSQW